MGPKYEFITVEREDRLTLVTLNRPAVHNALHVGAHAELERAFDEFEHDDHQWVAIITGAGEKAFCSGNDLRQQAEGEALASGGCGSRFSRP
jgi:enoyl-CoA hydratase/carnithine racemase